MITDSPRFWSWENLKVATIIMVIGTPFVAWSIINTKTAVEPRWWGTYNSTPVWNRETEERFQFTVDQDKATIKCWTIEGASNQRTIHVRYARHSDHQVTIEAPNEEKFWIREVAPTVYTVGWSEPHLVGEDRYGNEHWGAIGREDIPVVAKE